MLKEIRNKFINGELTKDEYFKEMFKIHCYLFEYPALLENSPIKLIKISREDVLFTVDCNGYEIILCCDKRDAHSNPMYLLNIGMYESEEMKMIFRLIKPGDVIFDIGANIGWYTINILLKYNKEVSVYSFEPMPLSYHFLKKNLELNGCQDIAKTFNFGFFDKDGIIKCFYNIECSPASSLRNIKETDNVEKVECKFRKMDDFVLSELSTKKLDFIKCDVEGAELFVFLGAIKTLEQYKPIVFTEMLRKWSKKFEYHPNDIINLFNSIEYECYVIDNEKIKKFEYVDEETIETNYLFFHKQKHKNIVKNLLL